MSNSNPVKKHLAYSLPDFYKDYKKECKNSTKYTLRSKVKYKEYIYDIFSEIFSKIVKDAWHFVLPHSLGEFYIEENNSISNMGIYCKKIGLDKSKGITYIRNDHTLGKTFRFKWDKTYANFPNHKYYKFVLLHGRNKLHQKYNVGRKFISDFYFSIGSNPMIKLIKPYNKAIRKLEEPTYEN